MKNILQYLELSTKKYQNKTIFIEEKNSISYNDFTNYAKKIGSYIINNINKTNCGIAIYTDKNINNLLAMFGILYSGNYYTVIDSTTPYSRINKILDTLKPILILTEDKLFLKAQEFSNNINILNIDEAKNYKIDEAKLQIVRNKMIDTDIAYTLFTSGSTGVPKGTVVNHRSVITYVKWFIKEFNINENTIFGSQTPFYFSMSVSDLFGTIFTGATMCIIPKTYFSFPLTLIEFLDLHKVNTIYWVPSALGIVANFKLFDYKKPLYLNKVLFAGEVMPMKQLNYWINNLENVEYANLFGPTESTDICTFYKVNRKFKDDEALPIGNACDNIDVFVIDENGKLSDSGELYIRGSFLADGYIDNFEKTNSVFVQNPINTRYPEIVYKTGDLVKYNEYGELMYLSRKDFQIKHMGYRIEIGEIETIASSQDKIKSSVIIYDNLTDDLILIYEGRCKEEEVLEYIRSKLPYYMIPNKVIKIKQMIYNANGKIDRNYLKNNYKNL